MNTFTPKIGIIVIVLFLVISAAVMVYNRNENTSTGSSASNSPYMPNNSTLSANAEKEGNIGDYYDGTKSATDSSPATPVPKLADIKIYVYPSSTVKVSTITKLELESDQSAEKITDWYKKKINDLNFNAKSFAQTNTEGVIFNKLSAARPGEKLDITIKKDQNTSKVLITVDRS